jgi:hypothetical protein
MPTTLAITAIITLALSIACLRMASNGERSRLAWMGLVEDLQFFSVRQDCFRLRPLLWLFLLYFSKE